MKKFCVLLIACSLFSIATMAQTTKPTEPQKVDSLTLKLSINDINLLFQGFDVTTTNLPKSKAPSDEMVATLTIFQHIKELIVAKYNLNLTVKKDSASKQPPVNKQ